MAHVASATGFGSVQYGNYIWFGPATTVVGISLQFNVIGPACLAGCCMIMLLMFTNAKLAALQGRWSEAKLQHSDSRITKISYL